MCVLNKRVFVTCVVFGRGVGWCIELCHVYFLSFFVTSFLRALYHVTALRVLCSHEREFFYIISVCLIIRVCPARMIRSINPCGFLYNKCLRRCILITRPDEVCFVFLQKAEGLLRMRNIACRIEDCIEQRCCRSLLIELFVLVGKESTERECGAG